MITQQAPEAHRVSTSNLAAALYLHSAGNRVTDIERVDTWPYNMTELSITFEGRRAHEDYRRFIEYGYHGDLIHLEDLFEKLSLLILRKKERTEVQR